MIALSIHRQVDEMMFLHSSIVRELEAIGWFAVGGKKNPAGLFLRSG